MPIFARASEKANDEEREWTVADTRRCGASGHWHHVASDRNYETGVDPMKRSIFPGWWQVAVCMLMQASATGTIVTCFSVIVAPLSREFGATRQTLGLIMTLTYLVSGVLCPVLGVMMDRRFIRKIFISGGVLLAAGYLALSFANSMSTVFIAFGLPLALANVTLGPLSYSTLLPRWFVARRARAVGITVAGYAIGGLVLPPLFASLIDTFGWRAALRLFAAFVIVVLVPLIAWLVVDKPADLNLYPDGDTRPPRTARSPNANPTESTRQLMRDVNFWVITLAIGLVLRVQRGSCPTWCRLPSRKA
jgi:MFS family permease